MLVVDLESRAHSVIKFANYPCAIAVDSKTHMAYVAHYADNTVTVIDGGGGTVRGTIPVGSHPQSVAVDPNRNRVYVGNMQDNSVSVIEPSRMKVIQTLPAGNHPYSASTQKQAPSTRATSPIQKTPKPLSILPSSSRRRPKNSHSLRTIETEVYPFQQLDVTSLLSNKTYLTTGFQEMIWEFEVQNSRHHHIHALTLELSLIPPASPGTDNPQTPACEASIYR